MSCHLEASRSVEGRVSAEMGLGCNPCSRSNGKFMLLPSSQRTLIPSALKTGIMEKNMETNIMG